MFHVKHMTNKPKLRDQSILIFPNVSIPYVLFWQDKNRSRRVGPKRRHP